jgi:hypothetical protein
MHVDMTDAHLRARRGLIEERHALMAAGHHPARPERPKCARCPHLFACGAAPAPAVSG